MPVTYTNRKGITYYLCQGMTKTGKVRYYFARQPRAGSPDQIPEGYLISESVNGVVSLALSRTPLIYEREVASVDAILTQHPKSRDYRVIMKNSQIIIYERIGPDVDILSDLFENFTPLPQESVKKRIQEQLDKMACFNPILRFTLVDPDGRQFTAERWSFFGGIDDWFDTGESGRIDNLAHKLIPKLGSNDFFEMF